MRVSRKSRALGNFPFGRLDFKENVKRLMRAVGRRNCSLLHGVMGRRDCSLLQGDVGRRDCSLPCRVVGGVWGRKDFSLPHRASIGLEVSLEHGSHILSTLQPLKGPVSGSHQLEPVKGTHMSHVLQLTPSQQPACTNKCKNNQDGIPVSCFDERWPVPLHRGGKDPQNERIF